MMQELSDLVLSDVKVWVPDERGVLIAAGDLVFNDAPWLGAQQEAAHFVHPKISFEACYCLLFLCATPNQSVYLTSVADRPSAGRTFKREGWHA